jgi:endonuclease/exonuclease/phosphatase family metal-dependent hydrolase
MHGTPRRRRQAAHVSRLAAPLLGALVLAAGAPAAAPPATRVLVFNIHAGKDAAEKPNLDGVAGLVKSTRADLVLLQEVDRHTARSGDVDQVAALQHASGYDAAFGPSLIHYDGGEYGIAVLAREAIGFHATYPLPVRPVQTRAGGSHEPRAALLAFAPVRDATWRIVNTHLDPAEGSARAQEIAHLVEVIRDQQTAGGPLIVGGDFNSTPDNPVLAPLRAAGLRDAWTECGKGPGLTYPAAVPVKRIDYLFLSGGVRCTAAEVIETHVSDHRPLLVTLQQPPAAASLPIAAAAPATRRRGPLPR